MTNFLEFLAFYAAFVALGWLPTIIAVWRKRESRGQIAVLQAFGTFGINFLNKAQTGDDLVMFFAIVQFALWVAALVWAIRGRRETPAEPATQEA